MADLTCEECGNFLDIGDAVCVVNGADSVEFRIDCDCGSTYSTWLDASVFHINPEE